MQCTIATAKARHERPIAIAVLCTLKESSSAVHNMHIDVKTNMHTVVVDNNKDVIRLLTLPFPQRVQIREKMLGPGRESQ